MAPLALACLVQICCLLAALLMFACPSSRCMAACVFCGPVTDYVTATILTVLRKYDGDVPRIVAVVDYRCGDDAVVDYRFG